MNRRFFSPAPLQVGPLQLTGTEAHHLLHVLRAAPGDEIILFDGAGGEFSACIESTARKTVTCQIVRERAVNRELPADHGPDPVGRDHELPLEARAKVGELLTSNVASVTDVGRQNVS